jgi:hypothetical protein
VIGQVTHGLDHGCGDGLGGVVTRQVQQDGEPGGPLDQGPDRALVSSTQDEVAFRKTVDGPGGLGVAEVALRCGRLLGMFAWLFGVPWLIEICARSLLTDVSAGVPRASVNTWQSRNGERARGSTTPDDRAIAPDALGDFGEAQLGVKAPHDRHTFVKTDPMTPAAGPAQIARAVQTAKPPAANA